MKNKDELYCYGKSYSRENDSCIECQKKNKKIYNACKLFVLGSLNDPTYKDNDEIVRMTLDDEDWLFYCKKIIKRIPKVIAQFGQYIAEPKRGRKRKIAKAIDDDSISSLMKAKKPKATITDKNLSDFMVK